MNADATMLAVGNVDGAMQLFDLTTGEALGPALAATAGVVTDVSFSADGTHLATAGLDRTGALWRLDGGRSIGVARVQHDGPVTEVHYTPDGRTLVTAGIDGAVVVTDASTGKERRRVDVDGEVRTVAVDAPGKRLAAAGTDGTVRVFELSTGRLTAERAVGNGFVHQVAFNPVTGALAISIEEPVAGGASSGRVVVWDPATDREAGDPIEPRGHAFGHAIAWAPDGTLLAVATDDTLVHFYEGRPTHREVGAPIESIDSYVLALAFSPDGSRLATGSAFVRQWSTADHTPVGPVLKGLTGVIGASRTARTARVSRRRQSGSARPGIWDAQHRRIGRCRTDAGRAPFTDRTFFIDHFIGARPSFSPDGTHLATPSFDGATVIWDLSARHWFTAACDLVGRNLTRAEWQQHLGTRPYRATC